MAENKSRPTRASVTAFMNAIEDPGMRPDARKVAAMIRRATGNPATIRGPKYKTGKSFLYIRRLADVDEAVLERLIRESVKYMRAHYEAR